MSIQLVSILVLVAIFLIATLLPVHMGALAIAAAFIVGMFVLEGAFDEKVDALAGGFPGDLFVILAGVTFLFAIAKNNGTIDWLVHAAVQSVRGRVALIPWVMFLVTAVLTAVGAVVPAAVAIIAPVGMGFARRYQISPVLMGLMVVNGATAGGFSPISIFGSITNGVVERSNLDGSPLFLFAASFVFNVILGAVTYVLFGGRELIGKRDTGGGTLESIAAGGGNGTDAPSETPVYGGAGSQSHGLREGPAEQTGTSSTSTASRPRRDGDVNDPEPVTSLDLHRTLTLIGLLTLAIGALFFDLDVGFSAFVVAVALSLADPQGTKGAVNQIAWPTVLLVCGIVTYVSLMENIGTIDYLGEEVATIGAPLIAALLICYIGGVVSAFASTTGILGALIPLAVPFLQDGQGIGAIGLITALAISSSVVDSSPFSTSGSLVVANSPEAQRDFVFRRLIQWGFSMVAIAPLVTWLVLVVPGWL
ncbi:MAG: SLC13 family permease [Actinomycetota bacterium]|nr:SLC13 family permease [Actinomycetota bacterium]